MAQGRSLCYRCRGFAQHREATMARHLHLDPFSGISGDMLLAALVDLGAPVPAVEGAVRAARLPWVEEIRLEFPPVSQGAVRGRRLLLGSAARSAPEATSYPAARSAVASAPLSPRWGARALGVLDTLARAESAVHGISLDEVTFRGLGGFDTVVDVVGCAAALQWLEPARITCGPLPLGRGGSRNHQGVSPVPSPPALELLRGLPTVGVDLEADLVTPTGAALARCLAESFGAPPPMTLRAFGAGFGSARLPERPNCLRLLLGEGAEDRGPRESLCLLEANLDDLPAEILGTLIEVCLAAGALDAWLTPVLMKKGRPAHLVSALCGPAEESSVIEALFRHSSTLGIRSSAVEREALEREWEEMETPWGTVRVKVGRRNGEELNRAPEFEDCRRVAAQAGVPVKEVYAAAASRRRR